MRIEHHPGGEIAWPDRDPYHYFFTDLKHCTMSLPWKIEYIGEWNHPRGQMMVVFHKLQ